MAELGGRNDEEKELETIIMKVEQSCWPEHVLLYQNSVCAGIVKEEPAAAGTAAPRNIATYGSRNSLVIGWAEPAAVAARLQYG